MTDFFHIDSIESLHNMVGLDAPVHPLISIVREWPEAPDCVDVSNIKLTTDLYLISMKGQISGAFQYGRQSYDYQNGTLVFMSPGQVARFSESQEHDNSGWTILFHPDLIRTSELGRVIKTYTFFNYDVNEALHLSEVEKESFFKLVGEIESEIENTDTHSESLITHNLQSILKYSMRYYERQFEVRNSVNLDLVARFEKCLDEFFTSETLAEVGIPTVKRCGEALNISGSYLSDLLKLETGHSAKNHIHGYIIEKAKTVLLNSETSISEIAYSLGFEYPQHFSKLFKSKTGMSPSEYRSTP